jgi:hypothetical protein
LSFVILTAYAPSAFGPNEGDAGPAGFPLLFLLAEESNPATGNAGAASFPLLFALAGAQPDPDPDPDPDPTPDGIGWDDHSPDRLLALLDHDDNEQGVLGFSDHDPATVSFTDHTPDS